DTKALRQHYAILLRAMGRNEDATRMMQAEYHAVFTLLLQQLLHNLGDAGHDDENQALLWQLQQLLGRDGLLVLVQGLREHIDDNKYNTLLSLAQQLLGHDNDEAKRLEEQQWHPAATQ